ncbi:MAG TPA: glycine betaine ABC transporter substrate-binding protein [Gaiellaceae bacterium]|nr:glycine betaine ABC transporter substrate-binding protein [Gaiellaceae bacterium]
MNRVSLVLALALALLAGGCGGGDEDGVAGADEPIRIGSKNFTEALILGELYAQALRAKGYTVELKSSIGATELIDKALTSGRIDMYPEYTGTMLTVVFGDETRQESAEGTYERAKKLQEERGFTLFDRTPFSDSDALAVTKAYADEHGLETIADLAELDSFRLGGQPEFETRLQGLVGVKEAYELEDAQIQFVPFAGISPYEALDQGAVDVAAIFSTDPPLAGGKYVVLEDPEATFGFQNVAPVVDRTLSDELGEDFRETVDAVSALLTEEAIIAMNSAVAIQQRPAAEVARQFLQANDLLAGD